MRIINISGKTCRIVMFTGIFVLAAILLAAFLSARQSNSVSTEVRRVPIYAVETTEPAVAISFDASWGGRIHPAYLKCIR